MTRRTALIFGTLAVFLAGGSGCGGPKSADTAPAPVVKPATETPGSPWFVDATSTAKIDFSHFDSSSPMYYIPETAGSGCGWIDYDADGWPDLFCIQVCPVQPAERKPPLPTHKLYRNNRDGTFSDVTDKVGLNHSGYGMGCAVGDYNNDGYDDLVVTYLDSIALFENRPDGAGGRRFADVTPASKLADPHWATSCGWGDIDNDGFLDLYVCNYAKIDLANYVTCTNPNVNKLDICPPNVFPTVPHKLFRNNGDGSFTDVSESSGIAKAAPGYGFAVGLLDLDDDGKTDIYVANDMRPAFVFQNLGGGKDTKFAEKGFASGAALMPGGRFMAGMGVALGDIDGSFRPSVLVSNYQDEPTMVFLNQGKMVFKEWSHPSGLGPATMKTLAFGIDLFDADLDGNLDVAQANGHVMKNSADFAKAPYKQSGQLFVGDGKAGFREVSATAGSYFQEKLVGRGLAVADYDNDGRPDLAFSHNGGPQKLLRNETTNANKWVRLELVGDGKKSNRNAVGARIVIEAGGRKLVRWVHGGGSFLSASDRRIVVGLGAATAVEKATVTWPSGAKQEFTGIAAGRGWRLTEGKPAAEPVDPPKPG